MDTTTRGSAGGVALVLGLIAVPIVVLLMINAVAGDGPDYPSGDATLLDSARVVAAGPPPDDDVERPRCRIDALGTSVVDGEIVARMHLAASSPAPCRSRVSVIGRDCGRIGCYLEPQYAVAFSVEEALEAGSVVETSLGPCSGLRRARTHEIVLWADRLATELAC
ncbi:MAG: hypothetical protein ACE367_13205 [Acidimicrobiales bacterium]